jgi:hypothetical protein
MGMRVMVLAALMVGGCGATGLPITERDAMHVVWEQSYGMEAESRPVVSWHSECRTDDSPGKLRITNVYAGCVASIVFADGHIEIQSSDKVSDSLFALSLGMWKAYLLSSDFGRFDGREVERAKAALLANNL